MMTIMKKMNLINVHFWTYLLGRGCGWGRAHIFLTFTLFLSRFFFFYLVFVC